MTTAAPASGPAVVAPRPAAAWLRAGFFFAAALILAAATGVLSHLFGLDPRHLRDPVWWAALVGCLVVVGLAYWVIWPRGTYTLDRRRDPLTALAFGLAWGLCQAAVFLVIWTEAHRLAVGPVAAAAISWAVISAYQGLFHAGWWDRQVAPPHNKPEWNGPKVACCHLPNLAASLSFLGIWGDFAPFVLFQCVALVGSTYFMRFPRPTRS